MGSFSVDSAIDDIFISPIIDTAEWKNLIMVKMEKCHYDSFLSCISSVSFLAFSAIFGSVKQ